MTQSISFTPETMFIALTIIIIVIIIIISPGFKEALIMILLLLGFGYAVLQVAPSIYKTYCNTQERYVSRPHFGWNKNDETMPFQPKQGDVEDTKSFQPSIGWNDRATEHIEKKEVGEFYATEVEENEENEFYATKEVVNENEDEVNEEDFTGNYPPMKHCGIYNNPSISNNVEDFEDADKQQQSIAQARIIKNSKNVNRLNFSDKMSKEFKHQLVSGENRDWHGDSDY